MTPAKFLGEVAYCRAGSMAIETAIVAPVLALLGLGGFQVSSMVARQSELDSATAEAAAIVRTSPPTDAAARETIRGIVQTSIDPKGTNPNDTVAISEIYRCGTDPYVTVKPTCASGKALTTYVDLTISDKYIPIWVSFGVAGPVDFRVERKIQVS